MSNRMKNKQYNPNAAKRSMTVFFWITYVGVCTSLSLLNASPKKAHEITIPNCKAIERIPIHFFELTNA
jgi:hypothetical protein